MAVLTITGMDRVATDFGRDQKKKVLHLLASIERRVVRIEEYLELREAPAETIAPKDETQPRQGNKSSAAEADRAGSLEFKIGEYWLAHLGTVALLMGIAFLISYPFAKIPSVFSSLFGYLAVAGIFGLSHYWRNNYRYLSGMLFSGGLVLLYFATLRLHFFSANPVVGKAVGLTGLVASLALMFFLALRRDSELLCGIALFLSYASCLISQTTHFALALLTASSAVAVYLVVRRNWSTFGLVAMAMAYLTHLLWLMNNPLLGNPIQAVSQHHSSLIYLFFYGAFFASANLLRSKSLVTDLIEFLFAFVHGAGFLLVGSALALIFFKPQLTSVNLALSAFLLTGAIAYWVREQSKYASAVYASLGSMALSVAIFAQFQSPDFFIWLGWQSLLVISTAIWFRSRILIVVNSLIYVAIFIAYIAFAPSNDFVNLSYAIVALSSARILNWKRERLELKTDLIRNAYLASAFVIVLYGLYQAVPANYVSLSWLGASVFYFIMGLLLNNIKYRWLAILTIFALIVHVFLIDLGKIGTQFRILLFLAVGSVLLAVSILYSKHRKKVSKNQERDRPIS